jgi:KaiC/GvpD/RAD55 family RecA-like ATPase
MSDNIIVLSTNANGRGMRSLSILKSRGSAHDLGAHEIEITRKGLRVLSHAETAAAAE